MNNFILKGFSILLLCFLFNVSQATVLHTPNNDEQKLQTHDTVSADKEKINILLNSALAYVNKKGEAMADLKKAIGFAQQASLLSKDRRLLEQQIAASTILSQCYREQKDVVTGKKFAEQAVALLPKNPKSIQSADALAELSAYYDSAESNSLAVKTQYYSRSVAILRKAAPGTRKLADALKFLGDLKNSQYDVDSAIPLLRESLNLYQKLGVKELQDIYDLLGDALTGSGNTVEGLSCQLKALKLAQTFHDTSQMLSTIYYRLAFTYNAIDQNERTAEYMEKARYHALKNHNVNDWIMISANLGTTYNKLGKYNSAVKTCLEALSRCPQNEYQFRTSLVTNLLYAAVVTKDLQKAGPYYLQLKELTEKHHVEMNTTDAAMIEYLIATRQYNDAHLKIAHFIGITEVTKSLISKQKIEHYQFQLDSAGGNFIAAIRHLNQAHKLRDSLLSRNYNKQIGRMQLTFDLQKKNQEIAYKAKNIDLLTHKNKLQKQSLYNERIIRNLFIAAVIMLILLLGLSYNRFKIKQQANHALQEQQEEINTQNEALKQLLDERDWLLKEVHHRVKNNLQIVISLLNSQLANIKDSVAQEVIRESQHRMQSISLIHQKLYQFDNLTGIDAGSYIQELALYLQDSFHTAGRIQFVIKAEPMVLDVSQAVPVGLILNEAITNSIKYAFTDQTDKCINISLSNTSSNQVELKVSDNGNGLPDGLDARKNKSFGMQLMNGLSKQLRAKLTIKSDDGVCILLTWDSIEPSLLYDKAIVATIV